MTLKRTAHLWLSWGTTAAILILIYSLSRVVPQFEKMFMEMNTLLPIATRLVLYKHEYFYLVALPAVAGLILIHKSRYVPGWWLLGLSVGTGVAVCSLSVYALYIPIFAAGK